MSERQGDRERSGGAGERDLIRALIEDSPVYFLALDEHNRVLEMNPALLSATGYCLAEVYGRDFLDLLCHPADRERVGASFARLRDHFCPAAGENRILTKNGEELIVEWQGRPIRDQQGKVQILAGLGRDVTLYYRARQALEESEHTFRSIVEIAHAAMLIVDDRNRLVYVNPQFCQLVGRPDSELVGLLLGEAIGEAFDQEACTLLRERALRRAAGEPEPIYYTIKTAFRGGEIRWFEVRTGTIHGTGGERRVVVQLLDVTAEVRAKRTIWEREKKYRTLVQSAPVGILSVDAEGRIQELNPKMLEILGSPGEEATRGINVLSFPLLIQAGIADNFRRCFQSGEASILESPYTSVWGRKTYLRYHLTPLKREQERVVEVQAVVEDITEQKRLESRVLHSQKMEALGTLSGGFAHEFNNLLQVIQGYAELLSLEAGKPPQRQQAVREIRMASRRAEVLTRQLLTFGSKMESELKPLDLNREVRETMQLLRAGLLKNVEVELELGESLRPILADSAQLQQVLTNLSLNSVEAMTRRVRIRTAEADERCRGASGALQPGPYQHLTFADDGEGIDATAVKSIFDPFYTTKSVGQGVGLGLSVVYGIVRNHGGHIECRSRRGEGTIFDLFLPVVPPRPEEQEPAAELEMPPAAQPAAELGSRILLVDDEQTLRKLGREYLSGYGYEVGVAGDCEEALALFQQRPAEVDLVILDLIMPGKSGEWCLEQILRLKPEQKVLVTSGHSVTATVSAMLRAGASGFIYKPYRLAELLATIREILGIEP